MVLDIRPFRESDEPGVTRLWNSVFANPKPHNEPAQIIRKKLVLQRELFFVAMIDDRIVGTVMGGYDGHRGWIYTLAVDTAVRHLGLGTTLMLHVEMELEALGCTKINLQVVASNAATTAFYQKLGYSVEERISMGKLIAPMPSNL